MIIWIFKHCLPHEPLKGWWFDASSGSLTAPHLHGPPLASVWAAQLQGGPVSPVMASLSANLEGVPGVALENRGQGEHAADVWGSFSALASMIARHAF